MTTDSPTLAAVARTQTEMTVQDRSTEFVPVEGGGESTSAAGLLVAAYVAMWLCVFVFVWLTSTRLRTLGTRVAELESALKKSGANEGS
jgi:hypothetical protein